MFIELHLIQNFAPSNLNRDDTGNPKDTDFGGVRRARISSQAVKRAMREEAIFAETTQVLNAERSKWMSRPIVESLVKAGKDKEIAKKAAVAFVSEYAAKSDKKNPERSSVLIYFSQEEINQATQGILKSWDEVAKIMETIEEEEDFKKAIKALKKPLKSAVKDLTKATKTRTSAPDIALFGRMLAEKPDLNIDAASQVAHAISTHRVNMDMDFFTAVDDLQTAEETGSAHMGVTAFNSACFYRYARIDFKQLVKNLDGNKDLAKKTVKGFLRAALRAIPTGKQNSFAAHNPPSFALAVVRKDGMAWSLANAFEKPVRTAPEGGFVASSIKVADDYWGKLSKIYGDDSLVDTCVLKLEDSVELTALQGSEKDSEQSWLTCVLEKLNVSED